MSDSRLDVVLFGASGRMGRSIRTLVEDDDNARVVAEISEDSRALDTSDLELRRTIIVDFSSPTGALAALQLARLHGVGLVSGTTGLGPSYFSELDEASKGIPVLHAANMCLGVNLLRHLVSQAAAALPLDFEPELVELHHRFKKDSPSGTALALARAVEAGRANRSETKFVTARSGNDALRTPSEMGVFGVRGGDVVGEHTVYFFGDGERLELTHRATDRSIFSRGALAAAHWLSGQDAGRYSIDDVLGIG